MFFIRIICLTVFYFISVIVKGSSVSNYYRFIGKNCQWVWMQTRATIIYNTSNVPQYIVCMNYIIRSVGQSISFIKSFITIIFTIIVIYFFVEKLNEVCFKFSKKVKSQQGIFFLLVECGNSKTSILQLEISQIHVYSEDLLGPQQYSKQFFF